MHYKIQDPHSLFNFLGVGLAVASQVSEVALATLNTPLALPRITPNPTSHTIQPQE